MWRVHPRRVRQWMHLLERYPALEAIGLSAVEGADAYAAIRMIIRRELRRLLVAELPGAVRFLVGNGGRNGTHA
jgi:hypothetical protein